MRYAQSPTEALSPIGEHLPLDRISPRPSLRITGEPVTLEALAESIRRFGLMRPVTVRCAGPGRYVIISGNRRLKACRMLGWGCIPARILRDDAAWQPAGRLLEALGTGRMHYLEAAGALCALHQQHGMSWQTLAQELHGHPGQLQAQAALDALEDDLKALLLEEGVPMCVALPLLQLPAGQSRSRAAAAIIRQRLCARDAALLIAAELRHRDVHQGIFEDSPNSVCSPDAPAEQPLPTAAPGRKMLCLIRDRRLYLNAIRDIAQQMQAAGFAATLAERRVPGQTEMIIRVPTRQRRMDRYQSM